jgi:hypothetical protein
MIVEGILAFQPEPFHEEDVEAETDSHNRPYDVKQGLDGELRSGQVEDVRKEVHGASADKNQMVRIPFVKTELFRFSSNRFACRRQDLCGENGTNGVSRIEEGDLCRR